MSGGTTPAWQTTIRRQPAGLRPEVTVEVRVSTRRRKYSTAFWEGDGIVVVLPSRLPASQRDGVVDDLVRRVLGHRPNLAASDDDLADRAAHLADRYVEGTRPATIRWVTNQHSRWGSCTLGTREIRISHRLRAAPDWVLDGVIVHELAHLLEAGHGARFRAVTRRYPRMADVDAFLAGYSLGLGHSGSAPAALD